jgi:hypothetical protein
MVHGSDPLNHNIVTREVNIDESKKEQFLNVIHDTHIILDEPIYDDSINGASGIVAIKSQYVLPAADQFQ